MNLNHNITCPQHLQHEGFHKAATVIVHHLILIISRITLPKKFNINFTKTRTKFCLRLLYNSHDSYLFVNGKEVFKLKTNYWKVNFPTQFYLGSTFNGAAESREVSLKVDYNATDKSDILNIHYLMVKNNTFKYLMVKNNAKECLGLLKEILVLVVC